MTSKLPLFILLFYTACFSQSYVLDSIPEDVRRLIDFEANKLENVENAPTFQKFFKKLDNIYEGKQEKLHIFHIGGSHIQADFYSNKLRTYFHNMNDSSMGQRGFVFPYHLAHTNNPLSYRISANRDLWTGYRCSVTKDSITWGMSGITAAFRESMDTIYIKANHKNETKKPYQFDALKIFYNTWKDDYRLRFLDSTLVLKYTIDQKHFYKKYYFNRKVDSIAVEIQVKDSTQLDPEFLLMGLELENPHLKGIEYTTLGVNGASFPWLNRSIYLERQLSMYHPDLFIISIGTNDAYKKVEDFDPEKFRFYYKSFIQMIQRINPDCAILLTVPNDDYYRRRYPNKNTAIQQEIIGELAQEYNMAVWDLYKIMGGLGSSHKWYKKHLMIRDRIHFTQLGYSIKGDLLMEALVKAWAQSTRRDENQLLNHFKHLNE
ncbi:GDSL-type esterase/lipase family protein [Mangrovimonas futianensis]|uniref:GDSL-type esterase/lipase family protein n=1 Tax=Mangrovimonas futianensis TaxID=2895523 RepID=UPI001E5A1EF9|nr:GDSL-type esterase/lipase family protein [Mangrovimonas futianensis]MCF1422767.1 GDSL-type esterase/lipase family protein [Mangrovimonas futianensis]